MMKISFKKSLMSFHEIEKQRDDKRYLRGLLIPLNDQKDGLYFSEVD